MTSLRHTALAILLAVLTCAAYSYAQAQAQAQAPTQQTGTLIIIQAEGIVKRNNDQATATLTIEEQDKDKATAASRVNKKMKQGSDIIKREDPQALLTTRGYYTYPVYPDEAQKTPIKSRMPIAWRVGQSLEIVTTNVAKLPNTIASAQSILTLNGIYFSLSDSAARTLDDERIAATYKNLMERIASVARAMGRNPADAMVESIDFDGSGSGSGSGNGNGNGSSNQLQANGAMSKVMRMGAAQADVSEPSFEPGETTLQMQTVGKIRFR